MEARSYRRPIVQHRTEHARVEVLAHHRIGDIEQSRALSYRCQANLPLIQDQRTGNIHLQVLRATFEFPSIDALVADSNADTTVLQKLIGMRRHAVLLEV